MNARYAVPTWAISVVALMACSPSTSSSSTVPEPGEPDENGASGNGGGTSQAPDGEGDMGDMGDMGGLGLGGLEPEPPPEPPECTSTDRTGERVPLDMFIMMDRSGSMVGRPDNGPNVWIPVGEALGNFVALPDAEGLGVGIQFFPIIGGDSCGIGQYAAPAAAIDLLPGNVAAVQQAIVDNHPDNGSGGGRGGGTPTLPAIQGAIQHAQQWAEQTGHKVIVVLATDGEPNQCNSNIPGVAQAAAQGLAGTPSIETYVIGIGNIDGLNQIALAGGTDQALIVAADPTVASQQFLDAMNAIRGNAQLPCELQIPPAPPGEILDFEKVRVTFTVAGTSSEIVAVNGEGSCNPSEGGWYYGEAGGAPERVVLCPATCNVVGSQEEAQLTIGLGCEPRRTFQ